MNYHSDISLSPRQERDLMRVARRMGYRGKGLPIMAGGASTYSDALTNPLSAPNIILVKTLRLKIVSGGIARCRG